MKKALREGLVLAFVVVVLVSFATRIDYGETMVIEGMPETTALPDLQLMTPAFTITCEFECADGYGFALNPCTDGSLGACCSNGPTACANHGGMVDGMCTNGRLGMPCQPL